MADLFTAVGLELAVGAALVCVWLLARIDRVRSAWRRGAVVRRPLLVVVVGFAFGLAHELGGRPMRDVAQAAQVVAVFGLLVWHYRALLPPWAFLVDMALLWGLYGLAAFYPAGRVGNWMPGLGLWGVLSALGGLILFLHRRRLL